MPSVLHKAAVSSASFPPAFSTSTSNTGEIAVSSVFGILAVFASAVTIWQGHRFWRMSRQHPVRTRDQDEGLDVDALELGPIPSTSSTVVDNNMYEPFC
ncbi:MAG: hypothetical protein LQ352_008163 [Teloschistes flavicans]|nr:MAG: hypothetical protein LQ352_008163 [Teloschistes flavicans]